jgi:predicted PurR-regulated permease PerM
MNFKKSQAISMDFIVVVSIILFVVVFIIAYQVEGTQSGVINSQEEREKIDTQLSQIEQDLKNKGVIKNSNQLDKSKFESLDLTELKEEYGVNNLAIYFEKDNKLIKLDSNINCYGDNKVKINGKSCE